MAQVAALFDATEEEQALLREAAGGDLEVGARPRDAEVAVLFSFDDLPDDAWDDAPRLRWVVSLPAGAEHVPFARLPPGVRVVSMHGPNATEIAEHALALLLAAAKRIARDDARLRAGAFDQARRSRRIEGAHMLVVGAGALGGEILRLSRALGMRTTVVRASGRPHEHADRAVGPEALRDALAHADFVALAAPLTRATRGMIGAREFASMKEDAVLVNVARGKLVDRHALARHLEAHPAFTYATDVWWRYPRDSEEEGWDEPIARMPNVVGTPHAAGLVPGWRVEMVRAAASAVPALLAGRPPPHGRVEDPSDYSR